MLAIPAAGPVHSEHFVFVGKAPQRIGDPTDIDEAIRLEWVPVSSLPSLAASGEIWNAGSLVAVLRLLMSDAA